MGWTQLTFAAAIRQVVHKATHDEAFRKQVMNDVHSAIKDISDQEVPQDFKINVVDGTGYQLTIVLPAMNPSGDELSDRELDTVAGGLILDGVDYGQGSPKVDFQWPATPENKEYLNGNIGTGNTLLPKKGS